MRLLIVLLLLVLMTVTLNSCKSQKQLDRKVNEDAAAEQLRRGTFTPGPRKSFGIGP
jgi:uncharacterized membrane protein